MKVIEIALICKGKTYLSFFNFSIVSFTFTSFEVADAYPKRGKIYNSKMALGFITKTILHNTFGIILIIIFWFTGFYKIYRVLKKIMAP